MALTMVCCCEMNQLSPHAFKVISVSARCQKRGFVTAEKPRPDSVAALVDGQPPTKSVAQTL